MIDLWSDDLANAMIAFDRDRHENEVAETAKYGIETRLTELLIATRKPFPRDDSDLAEFAEACRLLEIRTPPEKAVKPSVVAYWLRRLVLMGRSHDDVVRACASIDAAHEVHDFAPPSGHSYVRTALAFNRERNSYGNEETAQPTG